MTQGTIESVELEVGESHSIEDGDTVTGTIMGGGTKSFEYDGDDIEYFELTIEESETGIEFTPDWPANVTRNTGLGRLLERFGVSLERGERIDLADVFSVGDQVEFEVEEEESSDPDSDNTFLNAVESSVRPIGEDAPDQSETAQTDDDEGDVRPEVLEFVDGYEGEPAGEVKKEVAMQLNGEHLTAYKSLLEDGDIVLEENDDGEELVFLSG